LCQGKAKSGEKAEFIGINEHFEPDFNAALVPKDILEQLLAINLEKSGVQ